jgi:hypothetical protein
MPSYTELPIVLINNYLWDLASGNVEGQPAVASAVWNTSAYPFKPFYPVSENFAPDSQDLPYILYDYIFLPKPGTFWPMQKEEADYIIVGKLPEIYYIKNYIVEALEKFDESAREVNNHLLTASVSTNFKYITIDQENYIADEKRLASFNPKLITCLKLTYEYTK